MSKVSDMVKMYSGSTTNNTGARKWQTGSTTGVGSRPPPVTPKPSALSQNGTGPRPATSPKPFSTSYNTRSDDNVPQWKKDLEKRRGIQANQDEKPAQENIPAWKKRSQEQKETTEIEEKEDLSIPAWKRELNKAKSEKSNTPSYTATPKPTSSLWSAPKQETTRSGPPPFKKPPPAPDSSTKPTSTHTSSLWADRNKPPTGGFKNANFDTSDGDKLSQKRSAQQNKSFSYNTAPKLSVEKSSGSFGSVNQVPEKSSFEAPAPPIQRNKSSFLFKNSPNAERRNPEPPQPIRLPSTPPPPSTDKPKLSNGVPRRLPIPKDKSSQMPPIKTSKPPNVILPKGRVSSLHPSSQSPMPSRAPPLPGARDRGGALPPPPGIREPFPPNLPPSLPNRPRDMSAPELPARPLPSPTPGKKSMPLPLPPSDVDDIYDDPGEEPLPPLPTTPRGFPVPLKKKESFDMIPTWDDEADAIYDETPDEPPPPARSAFPPGFPVGSSAQIPEDDGEDMYEDFEETRAKKSQPLPPTTPMPPLPPPQRNTNGSVTSNEGKDKKDKKKKEAEKKDKEMRKKYKLGEGEIVAEGHGVVKETCKGGWGKGLAMNAGENIDIIRMNDNPKGKWLVRNAQGEFGYVDSDKVTINIDQLRNTFGVGGGRIPGAAPPVIGGGAPALIPTMDDEDIYDMPPDEDVYEEF